MDNIYLKEYTERFDGMIADNTETVYYEKFKEFSSDKISLIFVGGEPAGWIYLDIPEISLYSGFVFIYIFPQFRRNGIGTNAYRYAEKKLKEFGGNWWSSYPPLDIADKFALSVGFDYTNTNSYMLHNGNPVEVSADGIRQCRIDDYSTAIGIWDCEYAEMHIRIGLPYKKIEKTEEQIKESYDQFCNELHNYYVMESEGKIIGMGSLFSDNSGIGALAVDRTYTGRGYGTRMASFLTNECIRRGCRNPCLYCESGNDDAMHIYKKIGYIEQSRESVAIKN